MHMTHIAPYPSTVLAWICLSCHSCCVPSQRRGDRVSAARHASDASSFRRLLDLEEDDEYNGDAGAALTSSSSVTTRGHRRAADDNKETETALFGGTLVAYADDGGSSSSSPPYSVSSSKTSGGGGGAHEESRRKHEHQQAKARVPLLPGQRQMRLCKPCGYIRCAELREIVKHASYDDDDDDGGFVHSINEYYDFERATDCGTAQSPSTPLSSPSSPTTSNGNYIINTSSVRRVPPTTADAITSTSTFTTTPVDIPDDFFWPCGSTGGGDDDDETLPLFTLNATWNTVMTWVLVSWRCVAAAIRFNPLAPRLPSVSVVDTEDITTSNSTSDEANNQHREHNQKKT